MNKYIVAILAAGVWMNISEFVRNELLLKDTWINGFDNIGLSFPSEPINGALWGLWAFAFATILTVVSTKFDVLQSAAISWILGFVLLWIAMWNMGIMPEGLLSWAIPWSFAEVFVAALICRHIMRKRYNFGPTQKLEK